MNARLHAQLMALRTAAFRAKLGYPSPNLDDARRALRELDQADRDPGNVSTPADELAELKAGTVIRDGEGYVCERWQGGWYAVAFEGLYQPEPKGMVVLAWPEEDA